MDESRATTEAEVREIASRFFSSLSPLVLKTLSPKRKNRLVILGVVAGQFEPGTTYGEKQVNELLKPIYADYATLRRDLIDYGFLSRTPDGGKYWVNPDERGPRAPL